MHSQKGHYVDIKHISKTVESTQNTKMQNKTNKIVFMVAMRVIWHTSVQLLHFFTLKIVSNIYQ